MPPTFDPTLPLEQAHTIPAAWYFDPALAERERAIVFAGWQCVARTDQLQSAGSYVTADVAGEPIVILRDEAGTLRAFHNVCRHRAAVVVPGACGTVDRLRCRYHGWTYDLQGRLRGLPEFDGICDFRREDNGLIPLAVELFGPTVWVHPGQPAQILREFLSPLTDRGGDLARFAFAARREYPVACNWKAYVDNYLDGGYHINTVHPTLAGVLDYSQYRTELFAHASLQVSPLVADDGATAGTRSGREAQYWWVYPNFMINIYEGVMDTNLVLPDGPDRCRVIFDFYFTGQDGDYIRKSIEVADAVQVEDGDICAEVQRGLRSRTYDTGRYGRREAGVYHFHRLLWGDLAR
ncbi:MAG: aromatic ring-hydroxylating dioxygenase subunit alpha [Gemmataceae bacterium]|nr:aromatic ring-hydroxylating dioxygenase subunit alpha [Gemmataceae bacterium]